MLERKITLSLVGWQKRMINDHIKKLLPVETIRKLTINVIDKRQWVMYRQPDPGAVVKGVWNLYLTDAQISKIATVLGANVKISALRISPDMLKSGAIAFE